jgi:hypothetical protein
MPTDRYGNSYSKVVTMVLKSEPLPGHGRPIVERTDGVKVDGHLAVDMRRIDRQTVRNTVAKLALIEMQLGRAKTLSEATHRVLKQEPTLAGGVLR